MSCCGISGALSALTALSCPEEPDLGPPHTGPGAPCLGLDHGGEGITCPGATQGSWLVPMHGASPLLLLLDIFLRVKPNHLKKQRLYL